MKKHLLLLSFVEGGAVMAAELCGAKLLAPHFGSSLFVWATVLGFTLGALALGYFAGGSLSTGARPAFTLRLLLLGAGAYLLLMPLIAIWLLPLFGKLPFVTGMVAATMLLLVPPVLMLGATSPLFVRLQTGSELVSGKVSGAVFAVSTGGGITSTFACGFYLIPAIGLTLTLTIHGILLIACTALILTGRKVQVVATLIPLLGLGFTLRKTDALFEAAGIEGHVKVYDLNEDGIHRRRLVVNNIIQSEIDLGTGRPTLPYLRMLDSLIMGEKGGRALILGAGGGSAAQVLESKGFVCDAVELDPRIIHVAKTFFLTEPHSINFICNDARYFINNCSEKYDFVLFDVFRAEEQPAHVLTVESLTKLRNCLAKDALVVVNWHGYTTGERGRGTTVLLNTLGSAGFTASLYYTSSQEDYRNTLFICSTGNTAIKHPGRLNTDDRPLFELMNAAANFAWRRNYTNYYRSLFTAQ